MRWDPRQYNRYAGERGRPFVELLGRVGADAPRRVVDIGCGPGNLTALLADRWPGAIVEGIDSSVPMIAAAGHIEGVTLRLGDAVAYRPAPDTDVVISNAALQWVPDHLPLLRRWACALPSGAWLAWQVPGNFTAPSHQLMRELAESPRWQAQLGDVLRHQDSVASPSEYATLLLDAGWTAVDAWETTYVHLLSGSDPVLDWVHGAGLRPVLQTLDEADGAEFTAAYAAALRSAYPATSHGTLFPFRRIFCVGRKP